MAKDEDSSCDDTPTRPAHKPRTRPRPADERTKIDLDPEEALKVLLRPTKSKK